jgi:hypothetical protein
MSVTLRLLANIEGNKLHSVRRNIHSPVTAGAVFLYAHCAHTILYEENGCYNFPMKEISYEGPLFEKEEEYWEEKKQERSKGSKNAPPIRTFRTDAEELIQEQKTTPVQVVMAEAARREERGESRVHEEKKDSHLGMIIFILLLVLAFGIGVGLYALIGTQTDLLPEETATTTEREIPATTDELAITLTDSPKEQILADITIAFKNTTLPQGEKRPVLFLVKEVTGEVRPGTITEFLAPFFLPYETRDLTNSLDSNFSYAIIASTSLSGVISIPTRSYPSTFAAMLTFEKSMVHTFVPILSTWYDRAYLPELETRSFKDERLGTHDVRVLYDATGKYCLLQKKRHCMSLFLLV